MKEEPAKRMTQSNLFYTNSGEKRSTEEIMMIDDDNIIIVHFLESMLVGTRTSIPFSLDWDEVRLVPVLENY